MSVRVKAQKFGSKLSGMVIPNIGAFMAWGIITAIGVATGNEMLKSFISPMLNYLLPILIAFAAGKMIYDYRGGLIAAVATMGVIIGADITMFIGAMIIGPLAAWLLKKVDKLIDGKIPMGFELLINNLTIGILGSLLAILCVVAIAPAIQSLTGVLANGVDILINNHLLPLTAIVIEPAKILFLNNAIGQGVLSPIGTTQLSELGKSVLFLLESNPGPGLGILLAYMIYGKGNSKGAAYGASVIHLFGGIHEIYFPYVLMNPILILPLILGGMTGTLLFTIFNVGLIGVAAPGSIITISMMAAIGDHLKIILSILASTAVTFVTAVYFVKRSKSDDEQFKTAAKDMEALKGKKSSISGIFENSNTVEVNYKNITKIAYACDAGVGTSTMGASILQKKLIKSEINDVTVFHIAVSNLPADCDIIVTHKSLIERVIESQPGIQYVVITDYINAPEYDELVNKIVNDKNS